MNDVEEEMEGVEEEVDEEGEAAKAAPASAGVEPATPRERVFVYGDVTIPEPGLEWTVDLVQANLAISFPEIANAKVKTRMLDDGRQEITWVKEAGKKG